MKSKGIRKYLSSFLIAAIIFSLLLPTTGIAEAKAQNHEQLLSDTLAIQAQTKDETPKNQLSREALTQMKRAIAEQTAALKAGPILHPDLHNMKGDEEVNVIVELSEKPVALAKGINLVKGKAFTKNMEKSVADKVNLQQNTFKKNLSAKGIKAKDGFRYNYAFNGMAMTVKVGDLDKLLAVDGVVRVEPDSEVHALGKSSKDDTYSPTMNVSGPHLEVPSVWKLGYEGQNVKVAVLDTGIDYDHPEFEGVYKGGYNFINQNTGYDRPRADDDPYETSPLDRPANRPEFNADGESFYTQHGTHVAGTIAAQGKNPYGIKGLAPKVELYAYRVLGAYGSGSNSGVIAGIDKAVQEDIDIINLSLGDTSNNQTSSDSIAINNAALAGTAAVIATGNSGPNRGTIGNPGTAAFAISVGNSTVPETTMAGDATVTVEGKDPVAYHLNLMGWKFKTNPGDTLSGTYDVVAIPGLGEEKDYDGLDVQGKVALISRGSIPFVEKIAAAKKAGAIAAIIHNNTGTGPANVFLGDTFSFIPTFDMSTTDGNALRKELETKSATVTFSNFSTDKTAGDEVNSSSSRGPANPNFDLKPDVTAPGTNIMSSIPVYKKDYPDADYSQAYDRFTGTSMATPHVTGIAALLKSEHPDWSPFDLKVAITNTAKQLDTTKYDVFTQGAGRVQPLKAATTEALAYVVDTTSFSNNTYENRKGTITFGNVPTDANTPSTITKDVLVKNLTGNPSDYHVSVEVTKSATGALADASVMVDQEDFTLTDKKTLKVTLNVPKGLGTAENELLGYVHISNGKTNLNLPFAANFAPLTGLKTYTIDNYHISPNNDKKQDSTTIHYEFYDRQGTTYMELWDAIHQNAGYYEDGYLGYLVNSSSTAPGPKEVIFDGGYTEWGSGEKKTAPDGIYTVDLTTLNSTNTAILTQEWLGPVFIKTTAPTIHLEETVATTEASAQLSGAIEDSYVDFGPIIQEVFGEDYDVNANLHAKFELTNSKGELLEQKPIVLKQDGKFDLTLEHLVFGENTLKIIVDDEGQNHAEKEVKITRKAPDEVVVEPKQLTLDVGESAQLAVTAKYFGEKEVTYDATAEATYNGFNDQIISVDKGKVTAVKSGNTELTVVYGGKETKVAVRVKSHSNPGPDKTAPVTEATITGKLGQNGWYTSNVVVKLTATDEGSGVKSTQYRVNRSEWKNVNGAITLSSNGQFKVEYRSEDKAENLEALKSVTINIDKTAPKAPKVNAISDKSTKVTGTAEAKTIVKLYHSGKYIKSVVANSKGNFSLTISRQKAGTKLTLTATDLAGNVSPAANVLVADKTAPAKPTVNSITSKTTYVTGKAEEGAKVYIYKGKILLAKGTVNAKGTYKIKIKAQKKGTTLTIYAYDKAGNKSAAGVIKVK